MSLERPPTRGLFFFVLTRLWGAVRGFAFLKLPAFGRKPATKRTSNNMRPSARKKSPQTWDRVVGPRGVPTSNNFNALICPTAPRDHAAARSRSPSRAFTEDQGASARGGLHPSDRQAEGLAAGLTVRENASFATLRMAEVRQAPASILTGHYLPLRPRQ